MSDKQSIRIAYIGGGSRGWARTLMTDLALEARLEGEILLYDIAHDRARENVAKAAEIFGHPDAVTRFDVRAVETPEAALAGADFVVLSILPGPRRMFANDLDIPARYGIVQTVGDTTGPGGISRALRSVPIYTDYARRIMACCPDAWVVNYTNPMTLCTAALYAAEPDIRAFGCCHEIFGTQGWLAMMVRRDRGIAPPHRREIVVEASGVNHFTFFTSATYGGEDVFPAVRRFMETGDFFRDRTADALARNRIGRFGSCDGLVQLEFLRRYGVVGAAGDRHLVEFVPWWCASEAVLHRWGVSVTPSSARLRTWRPPEDAVSEVEAAKAKRESERPRGLTRSKEEGVDLMAALMGLGDLRTNLNLPNRGQMPAMPAGHVVETMANVSKDRAEPIPATPLPEGLSVLVERVARVQALTLRAALEKDRDVALHAVLADPLVTIDPARAAAMLDEMIDANRDALRGW